jgi:hypothetical protein
MTNLRKAIFYLQQSLRQDNKDDSDLTKALDLLVKKEKEIKDSSDIVKETNN